MSIVGGVNFGNLFNYLFFFANGSVDANWQGASKGFLGDVAINGLTASERTSGNVPYAGTITTNDATLNAWQNIVNNNAGQAFSSLNQSGVINGLQADLISAIQQINLLPATPGYESRSAISLDGLNTQNGINEVFVINITSNLSFNTKIHITGDAGDVFILRWDTDGDPSNGYQGQLHPHSGGAIVPIGGLTPANFISVAGDIDSSGGGANPPFPYPQGPRYLNGAGSLITGGSDWTGGGFFTGYLLTTGSPDIFNPVTGLYTGATSTQSNGIFVGGWYSLTNRFSMTLGTSGVHITPNPATIDVATISVKKYVSNNNGETWDDAQIAPGPTIYSNITPMFMFVVKNTGNLPLTNIVVTDNIYGPIGTLPTLAAGASFSWTLSETWSIGNHQNTATVTAQYDTITVSSSDVANYFGATAEEAAVEIIKYVSPDNGTTWVDANTAPGPNILSTVQPQFKYVVTNTGASNLTNVVITDNILGNIGTAADLLVGQSISFTANGTWQEGAYVNTAIVTAAFVDGVVTDQNSAHYNGVLVAPGINITKFVSPDGGTTWVDANTSPGPTVYSNVNPKFKYVVVNTGNVNLLNILVTDNVYGVIGILPTLLVGQPAQWEVTKLWQLGQHENIATVTATFNGETLLDTDNAWFNGVQLPVPAISIVKFVSVDDGATWLDANTPPGPLLMSGITAKFKYVVTNTGSVPLVNIVVTDNVLGEIGTISTLAVGASHTFP